MKKVKARCIITAAIFTSFLILLIVRLYVIDCIQNKELMTSYNAQSTSKEVTSDLNFNITDCNGKQLIKFNKVYYAVINPYTFLKSNSDTNIYDLRALTYILKNYDNSYDLSKSSIENKSQKLYWQIDENTYGKLKEINDVQGFYTYVYNKTDRGKASDICNILSNFKDNDNKDKIRSSIEKNIYTQIKTNDFPTVSFQYDTNGNLQKVEENNKSGKVNVQLTIDSDLNDKVNKVLSEDQFKKYNQIGVVVMESDSGDIKVMTQKNQYKGNINLGIEDGYLFPGSIFKTIVEEAALENNKIDRQQKFQDNGKYSHESRNGAYTAEQAYIMSSNEIFMKIGNITGYDNIYGIAKKQGLFDKVLNFNYEQKGSLHMDENDNGDISLLSIGQKFRITPLEALSLPNTVINNGIYVKPRIIKSYVDENSNIIKSEDAVSYRAISENTANIMQQQMREVTTDTSGTGKLAAVKNVDLGGKTGTATRQEKQKHTDGWFIGFFKCSDKYYSAVVLVPDINNETEEGGTTAAPVFKRIVQEFNK